MTSGALAMMIVVVAANYGGRTLSLGAVRAGGIAMVLGGLALPWVAVGDGEVEQREPEPQLRPGLVRIPAGTFWMGSPEGEPDHDPDEQRHEVTLTHSFEMCQTEVTQAQWEAVMGDNPSDCDFGCGDALPVHNVSWEMAVEYLNVLSDRETLERCYTKESGKWAWKRACMGYRLPTEAEWEYATRARTETAYSFGNDASKLGEYAWFSENSGGKAHPVTTKTANPWGLYDVHGNVWEWVWDWYEADYGSEARDDPTGPTTGERRVLRGGAFDDIALRLRSADRVRFNPSDVFWSSGFRCARGPHPSQQ